MSSMLWNRFAKSLAPIEGHTWRCEYSKDRAVLRDAEGMTVGSVHRNGCWTVYLSGVEATPDAAVERVRAEVSDMAEERDLRKELEWARAVWAFCGWLAQQAWPPQPTCENCSWYQAARNISMCPCCAIAVSKEADHD